MGREPAQRARVEPPSADGDEQRVVRAGGERGPRLVQVARHPVRRLLAERHDALLAALAVAHVDELLLEVDVGEIEPDGLGAAQAGGVDELDERAVAQRDRPFALERGELLVELDAARRPPAGARPRRGATRASGTRAAPSAWRRNARTAASLREIVAGASLLGRRPGAPPPSCERTRRTRARRRRRAPCRGRRATRRTRRRPPGRRVASRSESAGESRKRAAAVRASTPPASTHVRHRLRWTVQCGAGEPPRARLGRPRGRSTSSGDPRTSGSSSRERRSRRCSRSARASSRPRS